MNKSISLALKIVLTTLSLTALMTGATYGFVANGTNDKEATGASNEDILISTESYELFVEGLNKLDKLPNGTELIKDITLNNFSQSSRTQINACIQLPATICGASAATANSETNEYGITTTMHSEYLDPGDNAEYYFLRLSSVNADDLDTEDYLYELYSGSLGVWVKRMHTEPEPTRIKTDGITAGLDMLDLLMPLPSVKVSPTKVTELRKKHNYFSVDSKSYESTHNGLDATKLLVTLRKEEALSFLAELSDHVVGSTISTDNVSDLFGSYSDIVVSMFLDGQGRIIGASYRVDLEYEVITDSGVIISSIEVVATLGYDTKYESIPEPTEYELAEDYDKELNNSTANKNVI